MAQASPTIGYRAWCLCGLVVLSLGQLKSDAGVQWVPLFPFLFFPHLCTHSQALIKINTDDVPDLL